MCGTEIQPHWLWILPQHRQHVMVSYEIISNFELGVVHKRRRDFLAIFDTTLPYLGFLP